MGRANNDWDGQGKDFANFEREIFNKSKLTAESLTRSQPDETSLNSPECAPPLASLSIVYRYTVDCFRKLLLGRRRRAGDFPSDNKRCSIALVVVCCLLIGSSCTSLLGLVPCREHSSDRIDELWRYILQSHRFEDVERCVGRGVLCLILVDLKSFVRQFHKSLTVAATQTPGGEIHRMFTCMDTVSGH